MYLIDGAVHWLVPEYITDLHKQFTRTWQGTSLAAEWGSNRTNQENHYGLDHIDVQCNTVLGETMQLCKVWNGLLGGASSIIP